MKKVLLGVVALFALAVAVSPAWADSTQGGDILGIDSSPLKVLVVTSNTASAGSFGAGSLIFGFKLYADTAGDSCTLYDSASLSASDTEAGDVIDELVEPTDEDVSLQMWPRPYKLVTDLTVVTNGICLIYYQ
jgi:hypothetical protein